MTPPPAAEVRAALDSVFAGPAYAWSVAREPTSRLLELWQRLARWLDGLERDHPLVFKFFVGSLVLLLLLVVAHGAHTAWRAMRPHLAAAQARRAVTLRVEDAEALDRLVAELAAAGRFGEAMRAAFRRLALRLEAEGALAAHTGLTPRELAAAARLGAADRTRLRALVDQLYVVAFARRACSPAEFSAWLARAEQPWGPHAA